MTVTGKLVHPQTMGSKHIDSNGNVGIGTAHTVSTDRLNKFVTKKFHWKALDRKSTRLNSSHSQQSRMPSSA